MKEPPQTDMRRRPEAWFSFGIASLALAFRFRETGSRTAWMVLAGLGVAMLLYGLHLWLEQRRELESAGTLGRGISHPDPRPIEPDLGAGAGTLWVAALAVLVVIIEFGPLRDPLIDLLPRRLALASRTPAPPLRERELVLVRKDPGAPRAGSVVWLGNRRGSFLPELVTVKALGPDTAWSDPRIVPEVEARVVSPPGDAPWGRRPTLHPEGTMRVMYRDPRIGEESPEAICPEGWSRGIATHVLLPLDRARRLP